METLLTRIRESYPGFGRGEKKIAEWILSNPSELISLSISEMAANCGCGDATVIRFAKRLGLSGFQELKISIARELGSGLTGNLAFSDSDAPIDIYDKHIADIKATLDESRKSLNPQSLQQAAQTLLAARSIAVIGLGSSAPVAQDAMHKLLRAGLPACAYSDNHIQMIVTSHLGASDAVLAISHSGSSVDIVKALEQAKQNGAVTIGITNHKKSPMVAYCDICLFTNAQETKYSILGMTSRIAQLAIIDSLYTYIVLHGGESVTGAVRRTEAALESKKY